jgi:hypothetical protein
VVADLKSKIVHLEKNESIWEGRFHEQRKLNIDLENDLKIAIAEGMKYRDSLKKIIEIREMDEHRAQTLRLKSRCSC